MAWMLGDSLSDSNHSFLWQWDAVIQLGRSEAFSLIWLFLVFTVICKTSMGNGAFSKENFFFILGPKNWGLICFNLFFFKRPNYQFHLLHSPACVWSWWLAAGSSPAAFAGSECLSFMSVNTLLKAPRSSMWVSSQRKLLAFTSV